MTRLPSVRMIGSGTDERLAEGVVEALGHVARELHVLLLVLAHRDGVGAVQQDVRRHEHRVVEEPDGDALALGAGRLVLELRHAAQLAHVGDRVQDPHELGVRRHVALYEDDGPLRVDAGGKIRVGHVDRVAPELGAHLAHGDRVQIDDAVDAVVCLLHGDVVADGAEVVAEVQRARGLAAAEDAWASCRFLFLDRSRPRSLQKHAGTGHREASRPSSRPARPGLRLVVRG